MQDVGSVPHEADVHRAGVTTLAIGDRVHKLVLELLRLPQQVRLHKVHHGVVCIGRGGREEREEGEGGRRGREGGEGGRRGREEREEREGGRRGRRGMIR